MIIRFRSKDGMFRLSANDDSIFVNLLEELVLKSLPKIDPTTLKVSKQSNGGDSEFASNLKNQTCGELDLKNGEMLYLTYEKSNSDNIGSSISGKTEPSATVEIKNSSIADQSNNDKQLPIDDELDSDPGFIPRKRTKLCKHSEKGMCEYCSPLPPWDKEYQADHNIKHISFHAYIDELNSNTNKKSSGSSFIKPLNESNFKINKKCTNGHEPWPKGICSKCQPSAITLQRQNFRMVDHVEFQDSEIINDFINSWRISGSQRIGLMLGSYKKYDKVPLGIKAEVEAIYELPQVDQDDGIILQNWDEESKFFKFVNKLELVPIGIIFTDLSDSGKGDGSVICKRHKDSFFLSSLEIIFSVKWQLKFPNICKWSDSFKFSSKFVTCVISGNNKGEISIEAYQASEPAEGLVKADLICPSTHPNQVYIEEQNNDRYVPDIFYQMINEYGLLVKNNAKPSFPVEYLLVSLTHGFPENSKPFFKNNTDKFPIENRGYLGEFADISSLKKYFRNGFGMDADKLAYELSNFHLLNYLINDLDILSNAEKDQVLKVVLEYGNSTTNYREEAYKLLESPGWQTLATIISVDM